MKNKFRKGCLIFIVDENGRCTNMQAWLDKDRELEKGDIFELTTTKHAPKIKMQVVSDESFHLTVRELD